MEIKGETMEKKYIIKNYISSILNDTKITLNLKY